MGLPVTQPIIRYGSICNLSSALHHLYVTVFVDDGPRTNKDGSTL